METITLKTEKRKLTMGTKQKQRHNGLRGKTSGFGIGFPLDRERKHTERRDARGRAMKGEELGKGNANDTLLK